MDGPREAVRADERSRGDRSGREGLGPRHRIRRHAEVQLVQRRGRRTNTTWFVVCAWSSPASAGRVACSVSKKVGNAVVRNRFKRMIRETWRTMRPRPVGLDMVVIVRTDAAQAERDRLRSDLAEALRRATQWRRAAGHEGERA